MNTKLALPFLAAFGLMGCGPELAMNITWSFPANATCAQAEPPHVGAGQGGVAYVDIVIDALPPVRAMCNSGSSAEGAAGFRLPQIGTTLTTLQPGLHTITASAFTASNIQMFTATSSVNLVANAPLTNPPPVPVPLIMTWTRGGATVSWALYHNSSFEDCTMAGNPTIYTQFKDTTTGADVYPSGPDPLPCYSSPAKYYYLPVNGFSTAYQVIMIARLGITQWNDIQSSPQTVNVTPGVFPPDLNAIMFQLNRTP
jgi:hypothetical protein